MIGCPLRRARLIVRGIGCIIALLGAGSGCLSDFAERSSRLDPKNSVALVSHEPQQRTPPSTRAWLTSANRQLSPLLPNDSHHPLLTEQLVRANGKPVDVFRAFGLNSHGMQNLILNFRGLKYSAQAATRGYCIEQEAPSWPGFEDLWIPIRLPAGEQETLSLSGRLGYAHNTDGSIKDADCLVLMPGLFGDHGVGRSRDLAMPLREAGFHVLDLEMRGHGQTEARYPRMYHSFGALETDDLMQVSDWLEHRPHIRRTGLIAYCWNANIALMAAWYDGSLPDDPLISATIRQNMVAFDPLKRRFSAGIMAFSPVVRGEELMDELAYGRSRWKHPIFAAIQDTVRDREKRKGYPVTGNLRQLMDEEYGGYNVPETHGLVEGYPMLRLMPYKNQSAGRKLEFARIPVIIVHGADDPLVPSQDIADLMARVENPRVAAIILPSGGHVGFAVYAPDYYFSLITNFFDPVHGAAGTSDATPLAAGS